MVSPVRIGWFTLNNFFRGFIDDIRIYNRAITDEEVKELYNETLNDGLIAYYPFNENANDESGNGLDLTIHGAILASDRFGNQNSAYFFNGVDNYLENKTGLQSVTDQVSVSLWFYKPSFWEDAYQRILATGDNASIGRYGIILGQGLSSRTEFHFLINSPDSRVPTNHPSLNNWHHVVGVYDGTKTKLYVDNILIGEQSYTGNLNVVSPLRIGWFTLNNFFRGFIDDIRIYNRPLNKFEINQLFEMNNQLLKSIIVLKPNGGENWTAGSTETISWSSNNIGNINLKFSKDNGGSWNTIESNIPAVISSFEWVVPNISSTNCLIKAIDANDPNVYDVSGQPFTIVEQVITPVIQADSVWFDTNYDGTELGMVDASSSSINFGNIISYVWTVGSDTVGFGVNPTIELSSGTNEVVLHLKSDLGISKNDTIYISVYAAALETDGPIYSSVSKLDDKSLFVSSTDDKIYKFDSTGTIQWTILTGGAIQSTICITNENNIYVGSTDTRLYAFDNLGTPQWDKAMGGIILSSPSSGPNNTIVVGLSSGRLFALNESGQILWNFQAGGSIISSPSITNDRIYFGCTDKKVYSVSLTGDLINTFEAQDSILSSPALSQDSAVIIGANDGYLYSLTKNLQLKWKFYTLGKIKSSPVIDNEGNIYVGSSSGFVYALNKNSDLLWKYNAGSPVNGNPSLGPDGSIYIGCDNGKLLVLDKTTSKLKWYLQTDKPVLAAPIVTTNGLIYIAGTDGKVYILKDNKIKLEKIALGNDFQWPTFKGNYQRTGYIDMIPDVKNLGEFLPAKYSLSRNYPNPFNPSTKIKYSLPSASDVKLEVYNLVGQKVKTLLNGTKSAGFYEFDINASNLASGVYLITLKARSIDGKKSFSKTEKMILLK